MGLGGGRYRPCKSLHASIGYVELGTGESQSIQPEFTHRKSVRVYVAILALIVWTGKDSRGAFYLAIARQGLNDEGVVMGNPPVKVEVHVITSALGTTASAKVEGASTNA